MLLTESLVNSKVNLHFLCASLSSLLVPRRKYTYDQTLTYMPTGVKSYEVSLETQTAKVVAEESLSYEKVLETIKKTGKKVTGGEADGEKKSIDLPKADL